LHVIDASDQNRRDRISQVNQVIAEIGAADVRQIEIFNKIDLINEAPRIQRDEEGRIVRVWLSAADGQGLELLVEALRESLSDGDVAHGRIRLRPSEARFRASLYQEDAVMADEVDETGRWILDVAMPRRRFLSLCRRDGVDPQRLDVRPCRVGDGYLQSRTVA
jgi:GTP-binding protein HflX